jgi:hypothetical protein
VNGVELTRPGDDRYELSSTGDDTRSYSSVVLSMVRLPSDEIR